MKNFLKITLISLLSFVLSGCNGDKDGKIVYQNGDDFAKATVGVIMGTTRDKFMEDNYPGAKVIRLDTMSDLYLALKNKKCDIILVDADSHRSTHGKDHSVSVIVPEIYSENFGIGFSKNNATLRKEFNKFLSDMRSSGLYDQMSRRWMDSISTAKIPNLSSVKRSGKPIKVGCSASNEPFDFISNGANAGFDIELVQRFAAYLKRPIEFSVITFGGLISALSSDMVDMIASAITITPEREKQVAFSDSYFKGSSCVVVREENAPDGISSMGDVYDQKIAVLLGSAQDLYITENCKEATILRIPDNSQLIQTVASGRCDVGITSELEANAAVKNNPHLMILDNKIYLTQFGAAFNKDDNILHRKFNEFLSKIKTDGRYDEICRKWTEDEFPALPPLKRYGRDNILRVGTTGVNVPFSFFQGKELQGIDVEIAREFAESIGSDIEFSVMNFGALIPSLSSKKINMAINSIMITPERAAEVNFSNPYFDSQSTAVILKSRHRKMLVSSAGVLKTPSGDGSDIASAQSGVMTGSLGEMFLKEHYPNASVLCFDEITDAIQALKSEKVKYVMTAYTNAVNACRTDKELVILPEHYTEEGAAVAVRKNENEELMAQINASIKRMDKDGTLENMVSRWIRMDGKYEKVKVPVSESNKVLKVGISASREPMCFVMNGEHAGLDCELIERIAYDMGMKVEYSDMKFSALTASLISNKVDVVISNFTATAERAKVVSFSDTYFTNPQILMVTAQGNEIEEHVGFFQKIKDSFNNNMLVEKRYMLILDGLCQTVIISIFAIIVGTLFGAGICFMRMSRFKWLSGFVKAYIDIMRGTPVLVLLMIVFYVIFAKADVSATFVAILTFAMNFAAYVSEMFRTSIEGIDRGQKEAGTALGFTPAKTFRFIILPQAVTRVLPVFKGESISLVKMTSVVGYIAVQDLTKASDIIRSRTFDAFFPLIVITIIYFILAWLLGKALDLLNKKKTVKE